MLVLEEITSLEEASMSRYQRTWATLFTVAVTFSLLFSSVAFAINDPK
jgi:hypothetical protein